MAKVCKKKETLKTEVALKIGQVWEILIDGKLIPCILLEKSTNVTFICLNLETGNQLVVGTWRWDAIEGAAQTRPVIGKCLS